MRGVARTAVVAGTATVVSGRVSRRQQGRWARQQQAQAQQEAEAPPPEAAQAPPAQGSDMDSKLAQLKDLGALKDQGVLTEAEFEAQKAKILNS